MKKVTFFKTMYGGKNQPPKIETAIGYKQLYTVTGTDIEISLIFEKRRYDWSITEEKSGLGVRGNFRTRKEAEQYITPELLKAINERLPSVNHYITLLNIERGKRTEAAQCS